MLKNNSPKEAAGLWLDKESKGVVKTSGNPELDSWAVQYTWLFPEDMPPVFVALSATDAGHYRISLGLWKKGDLDLIVDCLLWEYSYRRPELSDDFDCTIVLDNLMDALRGTGVKIPEQPGVDDDF
ncbi:hypothetical protein [Corynebacterium phocae]|uniref:hypothetical protein n=1 Tax=Corynebacterium phocae TaxID=161895 RepID=UPI0012EDA8AF|nr:hypothetical protein [Corynebacterium phocae]